MRTSALYVLAAAQLAAAHTTVFNILVNDVDQGLGNSAAGYIRSPPNNDPVKDVTSTDMTCNVNNAATAKTVEVSGGDKITFEWHHNNNDASDDIIADSHKGPVLVYIAPTESNGEGNVWLKLYEDGLSGGTWAVDTLITNKGKHSITLPDLAAGEYLLRPEIIALHEGFNVGGAQFYMECVQIKVTSSGAVSLPEGVAIPGTYSAEDPGIHVNIYPTPDTYTIPGPAVWDGASGSGSAPASSAAAPASSAAAATSAAASSSVAPDVISTSAAVSPSPTPAVSSAPAAQTSAPAAVKPTTLATSVKPSATGTTGSVAKYGQCGGKMYTGATSCAESWTCKVQNDYYSQCVDPAYN